MMAQIVRPPDRAPDAIVWLMPQDRSRLIAAHYRGLIDGYVMDDADSQMAAMLDLPVETTRTLMQSLDDRDALARAVLNLADRIAARSAKRMSGGRS